MAYNTNQESIIAFEVARAGGNVPAAVAALRRGYESFDTISESTLRRLLKDDAFQDLVAAKTAIVREEQNNACRIAAERRALQEMEGSVFGQLREDDALLAKARERLKALLDDKDTDPRVLNDAYRTLSAASERRREKALPVIAGTAEASRLILIIADEVRATVGPAKAGKCMDRIRERYTRELEQEATETAAPETNAS